jgi:hypothetical protein
VAAGATITCSFDVQVTTTHQSVGHIAPFTIASLVSGNAGLSIRRFTTAAVKVTSGIHLSAGSVFDATAPFLPGGWAGCCRGRRCAVVQRLCMHAAGLQLTGNDHYLFLSHRTKLAYHTSLLPTVLAATSCMVRYPLYGCNSMCVLLQCRAPQLREGSCRGRMHKSSTRLHCLTGTHQYPQLPNCPYPCLEYLLTTWSAHMTMTARS